MRSPQNSFVNTGKCGKDESCGKGGKNGKVVKERGGGEGCDGSRSIGETGDGADGVGTVVTVRGRC